MSKRLFVSLLFAVIAHGAAAQASKKEQTVVTSL
jgi:hypothetical protein